MELNYKSFGEGKAVIILHGIFGMLDNWKSFAKQLSKDYKVYILDQRDHGRSPKSSEFNYDVLVEDLHQFIFAHELDSVLLIGHSMGGKVGIHFTQNYPELVHKLMVVDMGIKKYPGGHEYILDAILNTPLEKFTQRIEIEKYLEDKIASASILQFLLKNLSRNATKEFSWKANFQLLKNAYSDIIDEIKIEDPILNDTLFIRGGESKYILESDWPDIVVKFENAKLINFENCGHWIHAEMPNKLLTVTRNFFK